MTAPVQTAGLTKTYGRNRGVADLTMTVEPGEIFAFLGPNGAGKSTTIRCLLGLQRPTSGRALVLGLDAWRDAAAIHRRVGYLPGDLALFPRMTIAQHLALAARVRGDDTAMPRAAELMRRFGVTGEQRAGQLSKGNRQKAGIVLAFMHRPDLLVLDEPASGLDPLMQEEFDQLLRETAADGRTVFLSSHDLDEVQRVADRVAIIRDGRLAALDTVEQLRRNSPQTVELRLRAPMAAGTLSGVAGVHDVVTDGTHVTLRLTGAIAPLLRVIADLDPVDLAVRRADLDALFLRYYRDTRDLEAADAR